MLDRESILAAADLPVAPVDVPEWGEGEVVYVRSLSAFEAEEKLRDAGKRANFHAWFAALLTCDAAGNRLFSDADAAALGGKSIAVLRRIGDAAQKLNGMTKAEQETAEKNSETIGAGSSSSGSPANSATPTPIECSKG